MAGKSPYTEKDRATVYAALLSNEGNVKRTARDTGVTTTTVRRWKAEFVDNPPTMEMVEEVVGEFIADAKRIRNLALLEIERQINAGTFKGAALVTVVGVLDDKITRVEGPVQKSQVDHIHHLPSADEARALLGGLLTGAIESGRIRQAELVDAELTEQAEDGVFTPLPALPPPVDPTQGESTVRTGTRRDSSSRPGRGHTDPGGDAPARPRSRGGASRRSR